jgi:glycosyltransferase involved in cell wall biosynthesis
MLNEARRIPSTLRNIAVFMRKYPGLIKEVLVVDDGSKDSSGSVVMSMSNELRVRLISLPVNIGKWAAIHEGINAATTNAVLLMDADGSVDINEIEYMGIKKFTECLEKETNVFGSRFLRESVVEGKGFFRTVISRGYRQYVRLMYWYTNGKMEIDDFQCPWKLIFKTNILYELESNRWAGDIELVCAMRGKVENVRVRFNHKNGGSVKVGTIFDMFVETWCVAQRFRRLRFEKKIVCEDM